MSTVFISLGSNLGDRAQNIARAIRALAARGVRVTRQSSLYETEPVELHDDGGWFLNGVVEAETQMKPQQLMQTLLIIERSLGRQRRRGASPDARKESRTIDTDVLLFGADVIDERELKIPHPRMAARRFVLVPLAEIAGGLKHPALNKTIAEMLAATSDQAAVRRWQPPAGQST
jgi:2-amino-4-hydroxy-6-hydroxymethyldihydropteridine diphosphokinase